MAPLLREPAFAPCAGHRREISRCLQGRIPQNPAESLEIKPLKGVLSGRAHVSLVGARAEIDERQGIPENPREKDGPVYCALAGCRAAYLCLMLD